MALRDGILARGSPHEQPSFHKSRTLPSYTGRMQLRNARLCLDCEEVHDAQQCPMCASETFAFITRWVPARERRARPRAAEPSRPEELETYREMLTPEPQRPSVLKLAQRGALGLALVGVAGWLWKTSGTDHSRKDASYDKGNAP